MTFLGITPSALAPRPALDIFGTARTSAHETWRAAVESLDWKRIYIEAQGQHLRHTSDPIGTTCGDCIKAVLLDTYEGEQLTGNAILAGPLAPVEGVGLQTPLSQSEVSDDPESPDSGRVADGPDAGPDGDDSLPASVGGVHP